MASEEDINITIGNMTYTNGYEELKRLRANQEAERMTASQLRKLKMMYRIPKVKKDPGGNPATLKARKKLLAQKLRKR